MTCISKIIVPLACVCCLISFHVIRAEAQVFPIEVEPGSKLWIEGSANVTDFTCLTTNIISTGTISGLDTTSVHRGPHGQVKLQVTVPVDDLNCGKKPMNRDMHKALKSTQFPDIHYELVENYLIQDFEGTNGNRTMEIITYGELIITGHKRTEQIMVEGEFLGPWRFRIRGSLPIDMPDYDIEPPAPMLGLVRVNPELFVHFDVILRLANYSLSSN